MPNHTQNENEKEIATLQFSDYHEAYAVPGDDSLIDVINPITGLTWLNRETLEEVQKRYPDAVRVNVEDWLISRGKEQDAPVTWEEITQERYDELLGALPPIGQRANGFLVGEPTDHHAVSSAPRYDACIMKNEKFYTSSRPLTVREWNSAEMCYVEL